MKYKLIKLLPFENSPKIGYISSPNVIVNDGTHYWNHSWFNPKDYPEFWEEVVEKDYEILSLVASEKNPQHKKGSKFLHNKDYKFKNMTPTEFWDIYSVKRISDNKIFTIGDLYEDLIIEKMFMSVSGDILTTYKSKQPLFTTEDSVDVFEGDKVYYVETDDLPENSFKINEYTIQYSGRFTSDSSLHSFSTKEKAEEYILMNKPCLSINEVLNINTNGMNKTVSFKKEITDLVKSKI